MNESTHKWLGELLQSGLVRAIASGGRSRGSGQRGRSGSYSAVMVYLALLSSKSGSPSMSEIQRVTGIGSKNTVKACIDTLESLGAIQVDRSRTGNCYEILPLPNLSLPPAASSARRKPVGEGRTKRFLLHGPDGHVLRSEVELVVDILLFHHDVPHATEVPYSAIFPKHDGKHTMDFLLTPTMGIEVWGSSGPDYQARRSLKEEVCKKAGFSLHGVESLADAYTLVPRLADSLGDNFGGADAQALRQLLRLFRRSSGHRDTLPGLAKLKARLKEVEASGSKGARLTEQQMLDDYWLHPYAGRPELTPRRVRRVSNEFRLTCPELLDAKVRIEAAGKEAKTGAGVLSETTTAASERAWAEESLRRLRDGRSHIDEADGYLGGAEAILLRRLESPEQARQRQERDEDERRQDARITKALRLYRRVEAAVAGEDNPYAVSDARKAKDAKREALRAVLRDLLPERVLAGDVDLDEGVNAIEEEIHPEDLADIL